MGRICKFDGIVSLVSSLLGMFSLIKTRIPPLVELTSKRNGEEYPGIRKFEAGNESSSLVSEMQIISIFSSIISTRL